MSTNDRFHCPGCRCFDHIRTFIAPERGTPHKCPKCDGTGGAERLQSGHYSLSNLPVVCNACGGTGVLWSRG
jgi:DnaJ-class molecular chaperone